VEGEKGGNGKGTLVARTPAGGDLARHDLLPPSGYAESYRHPGQYVELSLEGNSTLFALAGDVGSKTWEIFVRPGGDVADALLALPIGGHVGLSKADGPGFPLDDANGRRLLVLATGSGIAAMRPVLKERIRHGAAPITEAFLGVRRSVDLPMPDEVRGWAEAGVAVTVCLSREVGTGARGSAEGYVQDALRRRAAAAPEALAHGIVFAAGVPAMVSEVRKLAATLGLSEADVRTNY
jgi:NAD(P)H-flavin reductase